MTGWGFINIQEEHPVQMKQPKNTRTIGASMPLNQMFDMDQFRPSKVFVNPAYKAAGYTIYGTLNCNISGEIN